MKRFLVGIGVFLLMLITLLIGSSLVAISLQLVSVEDVVKLLNNIYASRDFRVVLGISGFTVAVLGFVTFQWVTLKMQREKTIAFTTPDGQVTVSLEAIENFVRRITKHLQGIKEIRPNVIADRKGLSVFAKVILFEEANIPEVSEEIQRLVGKKIRDMLGIEENIRTTIHIAKIISKETEKTEENEKLEPENETLTEPVTPYRNYPEE